MPVLISLKLPLTSEIAIGSESHEITSNTLAYLSSLCRNAIRNGSTKEPNQPGLIGLGCFIFLNLFVWFWVVKRGSILNLVQVKIYTSGKSIQ